MEEKNGIVTIEHRGQKVIVPFEGWQAEVAELVQRFGPWLPGVSSVTFAAMESTQAVRTTPSAALVSTWEQQVVDSGAAARIEGQHDTLRAHGIAVDAGRQLYDTGTRMAQSGYDTQRSRAAEHATLAPLSEVTATLMDTIIGERRRNQVVNASDFASKLSINGHLAFDGYQLQEQAIRGLLLRLDSPASGYVFGVRDRLATENKPDMKRLDRAAILETLTRECQRYPDVKLNLRMRDQGADIFAVVSPGYSEADAPAVMPAVIRALQQYPDVKATASYDRNTTTWEIRAQVHTPTPTDEQAVGEPFQGYVSIRSRDNGTGRLSGGGGVLLIACLNASVYVTGEHQVSRVHRGNILLDLGAMVRQSATNISALCDAWGVARADVIAQPYSDDGAKLIPVAEAIPGYYRYMLTERRGELVGVLPGRTATHAVALAQAFAEQRRDPRHITRADLANGFTRHIQSQPLAVQQNAEVAIADWLVSRRAVQYAS